MTAHRTVVVGRDPRAVRGGLAVVEGRRPGSVPAAATRRSAVDVLVVHPAD